MKRAILIICGSVGLTLAACSGPQGDGLPLPPDELGVPSADRTSELAPPGDGRGDASPRTADESSSASEPRTGADATSAVVDDATLVAGLRDRLNASEHAEGRAIAVRASDGVVTLTGRVSTPVAKEAAERLVSDVAGVQAIDNRIEVTRFAAASQTRS